ncbi:MAG: NAD(P)/FAD-dependent oxidoreductase [Patescibacteria group bacterium]
MKVLIVGGGIAGCATAALLRKYKIAEVTLVEKAPEFTNIGYLIGLWNTGRKVLRELGIDEQIAAEGYEPELDTVFDKDGRLLKMVPGKEFKVLGPPIIIKRADLHRGLFELLHDVDIRFSTICTSIEQKGNAVELEFNGQKRESFDLVIGADGIHSSVRDMVFGPDFIHHYGWRVWMWWAPAGTHAKSVTSYYGSGKICATLPSADSSMATFFAKVPPGRGNNANEDQKLKELFKDFCEDAQHIADTVPSPEQIYQDDIAYVKMPVWHKGNVVLMGDAQHAVSPVTGMGASMAMEDALVLVEELRRTSDIQAALVNFVRRREKRIHQFRTMVDRMDRWTMADGILGYLRNKAIPLLPIRYFIQMMRRFVEAEI